MGTSSTSSSGKLDITPDDPRWIGAWWGGFLLCGALLFLSALFMFGFPQALDEQDMDGGGESEQAMLPSSLTLEYQSSKPKGSIHGFDINSGLSVCEHLRGKKECRRSGRKDPEQVSILFLVLPVLYLILLFSYSPSQSLLHLPSNPQGYKTPSLQSGVQLHHTGSLHGDCSGCRFCCFPGKIPGAAV